MKMKGKNKFFSSIILSVLLLTGCGSGGSSNGGHGNSYTITWNNYDGTTLEIDNNVLEGSMPSYDGETPTRNDSEQYEYTFDKWSPDLVEVTSNATYTATYKSTLTKAKVTFDLNGGTSPSYVEYKYMDSIIAENFFFDVTKQDYNFRGWSYNGDKIFDNKGNKLSDIAISETMIFIALFDQMAELSIEKSIDDAGEVLGAGVYDYGSDVTIKAIANTGYSFDGWYNDDCCLTTSTSYTFNMPNHDINYVAKFSDLSNKNNGDTFLFGSYPQTKVSDETVISELTSLIGELPSSSDSQSWISYNWYISSSNKTEFAWYIDLDTNNDGQNDYRGVYFTSYRPNSTSSASSINSSRQDDNGYLISTLYFFKYEPIEWRMLLNNSNDYIVMSNKIIDSEQYSMFTSVNQTTKNDYQGNSSSVYPNNYQYSDLRTFLNDDFISIAFNANEENRINITSVDNSSASSGYQNNPYACDTTEDKVFAASFVDVTNTTFGFESAGPTFDISRQLKVTDYAACMGCYIDNADYYGCGRWRLRTPSYSEPDYARYVNYNGSISVGSTDLTEFGVVPTLNLQ